MRSPLTRALVTDWETTGLRDELVPFHNYVEGPQGIEVGAVVVNLSDWQPIASYTSRIRFLGYHAGVRYGAYERLTWSEQAQKIHGLSPGDLETAPTPAEVAEEFLRFLKKHFSDDPILFCAHNPQGDRYYTNQLMFFGGVQGNVRFHHRMLDSFTAGMLAFGAESSDQLFSLTSDIEREQHSALEDAMLCARAMRAAVNRMRRAGFGTASAIHLSE